MARLALLDRVPCPPANIHKMPVTGTPEEAALAYQATMRAYYRAGVLDPARPFFDVMLLGLGEDGHTASLFPGTPGLEVSNAWVTPVTSRVRQPRLTLTYPLIASSRIVAFLVAGPQKADVLKRVLAGDKTLPASRVTAAGELIWFVDAAASGEAAP
jgi:6-phosphogluconolactonase